MLAIASALDKVLASGNGLGIALDMHIQDLHIQDDSQALTELAQSLQPAINAQATHVVSEQQNIATQAVIDRVFGARLDTTQGSDMTIAHLDVAMTWAVKCGCRA